MPIKKASKKNPGVVYSGSLKAALRRPSPRKFCTPRLRIRKSPVKLSGGPLHDMVAYLADRSCTLPIAVGAQRGRYVSGIWQPAEA